MGRDLEKLVLCAFQINPNQNFRKTIRDLEFRARDSSLRLSRILNLPASPLDGYFVFCEHQDFINFILK